MNLDVLVVGAGVVGLATARALARTGRQVTVLETESVIGAHSSSRNSEVVHAGFYYPPGSLKADLCVRGRRLLMQYAVDRDLPFRAIGKLVVAANENELPKLEELLARGRRNDVEGLSLITADELTALEPEVRGAGALFSVATGIIDSHCFMESLKTDIETAGGVVITCSPVLQGDLSESGVRLMIGGREPVTVDAAHVIVSAGLSAPEVSRKLGVPAEETPEHRWVKGNYLKYDGPPAFHRLIYPLPSQDGLGIHATLDLERRMRFGPDTESVEEVDYKVSEQLTPRFAEAIAKYWPSVDPARLSPDYAGIRSKMVVADGEFPDFVIADHGAVIGLYGMESPGLTASLAIAEEVAALVNR